LLEISASQINQNIITKEVIANMLTLLHILFPVKMHREGHLLREIKDKNSLNFQMFVAGILISTASKSEGQPRKSL
jgi:hypothetical protein